MTKKEKTACVIGAFQSGMKDGLMNSIIMVGVTYFVLSIARRILK